MPDAPHPPSIPGPDLPDGSDQPDPPEQPLPASLPRAPLAYQNDAFLDSPDGRLLRIISEYQEPLARFRRERIEDTVVFFGSARFRSHEELQPDESADAVETADYYESARILARMVSEWAMNLPGPRHRFVITSGGGPGIMEAANRGAYDAGAKTIGLNIKLSHEQHPNRYITPALNFEFHYFFMRKLWFAYLAKALVVFPGGFGTLDEMFEVLTLAQTNKLAKKIAVVLYGSSYWKSVLNFDVLVAKGAIAQEDLALFQFADSPEQAFALLQAGLRDYIRPPAQSQAAPPPQIPAPTAQELLGPDITPTRP
jgi:uncharacterized protein (TIGR00730 family)